MAKPGSALIGKASTLNPLPGPCWAINGPRDTPGSETWHATAFDNVSFLG